MEKIFKALADLNRLRIMNILLNNELCNCEIEIILDLTQTNASRHLSKLKDVNLIEATKDAQWVHYKVSQFVSDNKNLLNFLKDYFKKQEPYITDSKKMQNYNKYELTCTDIRQNKENVIKIIGKLK